MGFYLFLKTQRHFAEVKLRTSLTGCAFIHAHTLFVLVLFKQLLHIRFGNAGTKNKCSGIIFLPCSICGNLFSQVYNFICKQLFSFCVIEIYGFPENFNLSCFKSSLTLCTSFRRLLPQMKLTKTKLLIRVENCQLT
ncbi:CLUMA_CG016651, isoform A [Clunio marinus]|uniref:CLUMA_CG016651, isoform A n=1 Tax=Clunio marinus TaxID=568069 RepID=A0A1J1IZ27_9DIPT|nr:CLUMA_CG016651, isoform A [Clunio marinus]